MNTYDVLLKDAADLQMQDPDNGIDAFLSGDRIKLSSMMDLVSFHRVNDDTLIHKAQKDLWKIGENEKGDIIIERLFDPSTQEPLRI